MWFALLVILLLLKCMKNIARTLASNLCQRVHHLLSYMPARIPNGEISMAWIILQEMSLLLSLSNILKNQFKETIDNDMEPTLTQLLT